MAGIKFEETLKKIQEIIGKANDPTHFFFACKHVKDEKNYDLYLYAYGGQVLHLNCRANIFHSMGFGKLKDYAAYALDDDKPVLSGAIPRAKAGKLNFLSRNWLTIKSAYESRATGQSDPNSKKYLERMRETDIAHNNSNLAPGRLAILDMECLSEQTGAKADMVAAEWDGQQLFFYLTEYKCTKGALIGKANLIKHYDDMKKTICNRDKSLLKKELLDSLKIMLHLELVQAEDDVKRKISSLSEDDVVLKLLFLFSDCEHAKMNETAVFSALKKGYKYILQGDTTLQKSNAISGDGAAFYYSIARADKYVIDIGNKPLMPFCDGGQFKLTSAYADAACSLCATNQTLLPDKFPVEAVFVSPTAKRIYLAAIFRDKPSIDDAEHGVKSRYADYVYIANSAGKLGLVPEILARFNEQRVLRGMAPLASCDGYTVNLLFVIAASACGDEAKYEAIDLAIEAYKEKRTDGILFNKQRIFLCCTDTPDDVVFDEDDIEVL